MHLHKPTLTLVKGLKADLRAKNKYSHWMEWTGWQIALIKYSYGDLTNRQELFLGTWLCSILLKHAHIKTVGTMWLKMNESEYRNTRKSALRQLIIDFPNSPECSINDVRMRRVYTWTEGAEERNPNEGNNTVTQKKRSVECMMAVEIMNWSHYIIVIQCQFASTHNFHSFYH